MQILAIVVKMHAINTLIDCKGKKKVKFLNRWCWLDLRIEIRYLIDISDWFENRPAEYKDVIGSYVFVTVELNTLR